MKNPRFYPLISLLCTGLLLLSSLEAFSQPERRIVPRHEYALQLPELGRMVGLEGDGRFGDHIYPLGPIDARDTLNDWAVSRLRQDTTIDGMYPLELLIYRGVRDGFPDVSQRERIGPTEIGSETRYMASADWDRDGYIDLATAIAIVNDSTLGNSVNVRASRLVIWWGQANGEYTLKDTTRLSIGRDGWGHPDLGYSRDLNHDGIPDLLLSDVKGIVDGEIVQRAPVQVWLGEERKRWGKELSAIASWHWWTVPRKSTATVFPRTQWIDQDVDGLLDFVWYTDGRGGGVHGTISIIYGTPDHILDTANIVSLSLDSAWGKYALFADITGDKVPELLVNTGGQEALKAYVGFPGQRLLEQYGLGNEPGTPGEDVWWGKPWATIPLPGQLHDGWAPSGWSPIFSLGDGGLDGVGDVWVGTTPDIVCYNGGERFDSIYDGWIRVPGGIGTAQYAVDLGDITGEGISTFAIELSNPSGIIFVQPTTDLPTTGKYRYLPLGTEMPETDVRTEVPESEADSPLGLQVIPNPASGVVEISWTPRQGRVVVEITDQIGQRVRAEETDAERGQLLWDARRTFGGTYWVTLSIDGTTETGPINIRR